VGHPTKVENLEQLKPAIFRNNNLVNSNVFEFGAMKRGGNKNNNGFGYKQLNHNRNKLRNVLNNSYTVVTWT
jgi:hypothetical protein